MPSGNIFPGSLARRVRHLERAVKPDQRDEWRARLERVFADAEYDQERAAIIEALLSDQPCYTGTTIGPDGQPYAAFHASWYQRDRMAPVVIRLYPDLWLAI